MNNMNNKGFTLVELLAVIVILVSISLVAVGGITASLENRDKKECIEQQELAVGAAKIYFSLNDMKSVTILELKNGDYFSSTSKINKLNDSDVIAITDSGYTYNNKVVGESCG